MALQKTVTNIRTGHANSYWRLTGIAIDAHGGNVALVLSGYADAAARLAGKQPDDRRDWELGPSAFALLAAQQPSGATVYDVIATASYSVITVQRRPLPVGATQDGQGNITLPTGEVVPVASVTKPDPDDPATWTVPSEFADAQAV